MLNTEIIARAIIINDSKILVCQAKGKGHYFLPGGHVEKGESPEQALARELQEEANAKIKNCQHVIDLANTYTTNKVVRHELNHVFLVELLSYNVTSQEPHIDFSWVGAAIPELEKLNILPKNIKAHIKNCV